MQTIRCRNALQGPYWIGETCIEKPLPSGWLPGDEVNPETGEYKRKDKHPTLVGIVDLTNRTRYGFSSRGVPLYLFYPLDASYPPMIVGSKAPTTANQFGLAQFSEMETGKAKWPRAALQKLLGPVGNSAVELAALRLRVRYDDHDHSFFEYKDNEEKRQEPTQEWDYTFNIDPEGCQDIDDVISWRTNTDGSTDFAISIADVSYWVPAESDLDKIARQRGQTVYENGAVLYPMLPTSLSEHSASLRSDGIARPVLSLIWHITTDKNIHGPTWSSHNVINKVSYTYNSVLDSKDICNTLKEHLQLITGRPVGDDPHIWIEIAMVTYNCEAAKQLYSLGKGVLRRHIGTKTMENLIHLSEQTGCRDIAWLGSNSGEYISIESVTSDDDMKHNGLNVSIYCHATSPLRRYSDLQNQRIIKQLSTINEPISNLCLHLNSRARDVKAFERDIWYIQHINPSSLTSCNGWIIHIKKEVDNLFKCAVYIPEWKRTVHVRVLDNIYCVGNSVNVTAYCDLRSASYKSRFVFQINSMN